MREPLHFNQSSPLRLPLPMMLAAPVFGSAALFLALFSTASLIANRWDPLLIAAVHLFTLGFLGSTMLAAILQLLPVLSGHLPLRNRPVILVIQSGFLAGVLLFAIGMASGTSSVLRIATVMLGVALAAFFTSVLPQFGILSRIRRPASRRPAVIGMAFAVAGFVVAATLGLWLLCGWGFSNIQLPRQFTDLHASWAMVGWVAPLVFAVSLEVVPMFQFTRPLPRFAHAIPVLLPAGMLLASMSATRMLGIGLLVALLVAGSITILVRQWRRPHGHADATLKLFRIAMLALLASIFIFLLPDGPFASMQAREVAATLLFLVGFAGSCIIGMSLKIVPFLLRLHLQKELWELSLPARSLPGFTRMLPPHVDRWLWLPHASGLALSTTGLVTGSGPLLQFGLALLCLAMIYAGVTLWWVAWQAFRLQQNLSTGKIQGEPA
ncbi:MAG: hypothetical protein R3270_03835 [Gammaproteobacteria bacterium]|nr:hypothetical protein [Gammaproteobacteria bacterium]